MLRRLHRLFDCVTTFFMWSERFSDHFIYPSHRCLHVFSERNTGSPVSHRFVTLDGTNRSIRVCDQSGMPELLSDIKEYLPCLTLGMAKASSCCNTPLLGLRRGFTYTREILKHEDFVVMLLGGSERLQNPFFMTDLISWEYHLGELNIVHSNW